MRRRLIPVTLTITVAAILAALIVTGARHDYIPPGSGHHNPGVVTTGPVTP